MFKRLSVVAIVLGLAALAYSQANAANPASAKVSLQEWKVELAPTQVTAGAPVQFTITNSCKIMHEFVIEKAGEVDEALTTTVDGKDEDAESEKIQPGETRTFEWTFDQPGEYWIACHIPGHFEAGMKTSFTVSAANSASPILPSLPLVALAGIAIAAVGLGVWKFARR